MRFWTVAKVGAGVLVLAYGAVMADRYQGLILKAIKPARPAMRTQGLPLGAEIADQRERRLINKVSAEYGRVKVLVDQARAKGRNTETLERMLVFSLSQARQKKYDQAMTMLNRIAMDASRPVHGGVTAARIDDPLPEEPEIKAKPVVPERRAPSRKRKRRPAGEDE
ncbi:MAG: hypothetical protein HY553_14055 [Elusimicrobia bacterium]|nr:hypothetical protein [Elusimicrobiota bacterium]